MVYARDTVNLKQYAVYLIRWQLSTPLLAPIVAFFKGSESIFGTTTDWVAASVANLIGGLIFYWVDRFIFTSRVLAAHWEVREDVVCADCGTTARGYRLIRSKNYDRTNDPQPEFRCESCSREKSNRLKEQGVHL